LIDWEIKYGGKEVEWMNRFGHLALKYGEEGVLIFGGEVGKEVGEGMRGIMNDLILFDTVTSDIKRHVFDRKRVFNRMHHTGFIIDSFLFVFGG
jgi:hypothetical protein